MVATVTNVVISISIIVINASRGSCVSGLPRGAHWAWMPLWLGVGPGKCSPPSASPRAGSPRGESSKFWRTPGWWQQGAERSLTVVTSPWKPSHFGCSQSPWWLHLEGTDPSVLQLSVPPSDWGFFDVKAGDDPFLYFQGQAPVTWSAASTWMKKGGRGNK